MLDSDEIKAVLEIMGGYGILRIIDQISFNRFKNRPKWLVGYGDTTLLHSYVQSVLETASLQATIAAELKYGYHEAS